MLQLSHKPLTQACVNAAVCCCYSLRYCVFLLLHLFSFIFYCETMACSVATLWNNWLVQNLIEGLKEEHSFEI